MMLSTANLLSPADGSPVVAPTQDMVLGNFYLTMDGEAGPDAAGQAPVHRREGGGPRLPAPGEDRAHPPRADRGRGPDLGRGRRGRSALGADRHDRRPGHLQRDPARPAPVQQQGHEAGRAAPPGRGVLSPPRSGRDGPPRRRHQERRLRVRDPRRDDDRGLRHRGPERQGRPAQGGRRRGRRDRSPVPARPDHRRRALRAGRLGLAAHDRRDVRRDDGRPRSVRGGHDDDLVGRPREQGQHRPARRDARPDGRPVRAGSSTSPSGATSGRG